MESYRGSIYSKANPERLLYEIDLSWLVVNDSFPGAERINAVLTKEQDSNIARAEADAAEMEAGIIEAGLDGISYSYSSDFSGFSYYDSRYISFVQNGYEYYGGAHGMPIWNGYTFDLQTGERLLLSDIIGNIEEELKKIVSGYFAEMINEEPENFWEDSVEYIYDDVSYQSDYYLTEQGIVFYYHPYELAAYAAGFQKVTIPYSEFDMLVSLEKAVN